MIDAFFSSPLVEAIGWSLLHSLWQGTLLAVVLGILLVFLRRFSSQTRYLIVALFMALFAATIPLNIIREYEPVVQVQVAAVEKAYAAPNTATSFSAREEIQVSEKSVAKDIRNRFVLYFERHLPLLVTLWLMGIVVLLLRYLGQLVYVQRLKNHGVAPFPAKWQDMIIKLEKQLRITRKVSYLESLRISSPMTIGWLKPVVLFPIGLATRLGPAEVEAILLHELAHIKRNDYLFNVIQSLTTILLFYHPAAYWMSRLLDEERENCCDDLVVGLTGQQETYASTLIHLQEQKFKTMATVLSFTGTPSSFSGRILRLVNKSFPSANRFREGFVTALVLMAGLSFLAAAGVNTSPAPVSSAAILLAGHGDDDKEKVDLFIKAIDDEDDQLFSYLLKQGVNINGTSSEGWTPLGFAAAEGRLTYVNRLLEKGAKVDQATSERYTPLLAAAAEGHLEVVKVLLEKGASVNTKANDNTALSLAAREGHADVVRFLMPLSPQLSREEKVESLINAIDEDEEELFEYFISQGADINGISRGGWTPLGFAAEEGHTKFIKLLIDRGAKINHSLNDDRMPLLAAAGEGQLNAVKALLEAGAEVEAASEQGTTALSAAAREGHTQVVDFLLAKGAKPNRANKEGWTALHFATGEGHTNVINQLLKAGSNIESPVSSEWYNWNNGAGTRVIMGNWTPLMLAVEEEHVEAANVLLEAGAKVNARVAKKVYAVEGDYKDLKAAPGKLLYEATGWTPLMEAVEKKNLPLVKLLLSKGADVNAETKEGKSARSIASEAGNQELIQLLR
ncbi:ankyrin repeat domain-containing protein [Pontibacter toksunensis]|uniref:Ankyrin repeat domain-containing protein n=1 Tax=Pontibacter toksunensis TaxID=1332631 RepID=A0ABW6C124_9BACT